MLAVQDNRNHRFGKAFGSGEAAGPKKKSPR